MKPNISGAAGDSWVSAKARRAAQSTHAPRRGSARGRGVWTLAEASVECRVISVATAAAADDASHAEERESAGGGNNIVLQICDGAAESSGTLC